MKKIVITIIVLLYTALSANAQADLGFRGSPVNLQPPSGIKFDYFVTVMAGDVMVNPEVMGGSDEIIVGEMRSAQLNLGQIHIYQSVGIIASDSVSFQHVATFSLTGPLTNLACINSLLVAAVSVTPLEKHIFIYNIVNNALEVIKDYTLPSGFITKEIKQSGIDNREIVIVGSENISFFIPFPKLYNAARHPEVVEMKDFPFTYNSNPSYATGLNNGLTPERQLKFPNSSADFKFKRTTNTNNYIAIAGSNSQIVVYKNIYTRSRDIADKRLLNDFSYIGSNTNMGNLSLTNYNIGTAPINNDIANPVKVLVNSQFYTDMRHGGRIISSVYTTTNKKVGIMVYEMIKDASASDPFVLNVGVMKDKGKFFEATGSSTNNSAHDLIFVKTSANAYSQDILLAGGIGVEYFKYHQGSGSTAAYDGGKILKNTDAIKPFMLQYGKFRPERFKDSPDLLIGDGANRKVYVLLGAEPAAPITEYYFRGHIGAEPKSFGRDLVGNVNHDGYIKTANLPNGSCALQYGADFLVTDQSKLTISFVKIKPCLNDNTIDNEQNWFPFGSPPLPVFSTGTLDNSTGGMVVEYFDALRGLLYSSAMGDQTGSSISILEKGPVITGTYGAVIGGELVPWHYFNITGQVNCKLYNSNGASISIVGDFKGVIHKLD